MELIKINCPSCDATLESEDDLEFFFCKYCGTKVILDRENDEYYKGNFQYKTVKAKLEHEETIEKMRMDERATIREDKKQTGRTVLKVLKVIGIIYLACIAISFLFGVFYGIGFLFSLDEQKEYDEIVEELEECLDDKDYVEARELYRDIVEMAEENYFISTGTDIEDYYIEIEELARDVNPDEITYIAIPRDSRQYRELSCYDAQEELENLGFYNIEISVGFSGSNDVYSIQIDGNSNFAVNDEFPDNAEVIIIPEP